MSKICSTWRTGLEGNCYLQEMDVRQYSHLQPRLGTGAVGFRGGGKPRGVGRGRSSLGAWCHEEALLKG